MVLFWKRAQALGKEPGPINFDGQLAAPAAHGDTLNFYPVTKVQFAERRVSILAHRVQRYEQLDATRAILQISERCLALSATPHHAPGQHVANAGLLAGLQRFVRALLQQKAAAARANVSLEQLPADIGQAIDRAAAQLLQDPQLMTHFPVEVFQTGSGATALLPYTLTALARLDLEAGALAAARVWCDEAEALASATRLAQSVVRACGASTPEGSLWEVDANLRPEGRNGALVRTLASYEGYYRRWASTWEFQALLKARHVVGDADLGSAFIELVTPLVWGAADRANFVEDTQAMRRRVEENVPTDRKSVV